MPTGAELLTAIKLPTKSLIGLTLTCVAILGLDYFEAISLGKIDWLSKSIVIMALALFGSLSITSLVAIVIGLISKKKKMEAIAARNGKKAEEKEANQANVLKRLEYLTPDELKYLADCLRENSQSFLAYVHSGDVTNLQGKALVWTPGGTHHQDYYPYNIDDLVWEELLSRKEEFIQKDEDNDAAAKAKEEERKQRRRRY